MSQQTAPIVPSASIAALEPVSINAVAFSDSGFLGGWQALNGTETIPHCVDMIEVSGVLDNFRRLVGESDAAFRGPQFADSDLYKTLEAIAWEQARTGTSEWEAYTQDVVRLLERAQRPDGYLNTWVQADPERIPFAELRWSHELYCLGHLIQAAVARFRATDARDLLDVALRFVDLVERKLGSGGRDAVDGHPEIETALVELFRVTAEERHLQLAQRFVDLRGHGRVGLDPLGAEYFQDHTPVREAQSAAGHAVRQVYLLAGETDIVLERDDPALLGAIERLWCNVHEQKLYVTGGLGSRHRGEAFGDPYELPPDRAYAETCAAIGALQWNRRMHLLTGESRFADEMERSLYNAIAVAVSKEGRSFFYSNPLHLREDHLDEEDAPASRLSWYGCACCPPNLARLVSSLGSYAASLHQGALQIDLYADGDVTWTDQAGVERTVRIATEYPWEGRIRLSFKVPTSDPVRLRLPQWTERFELLVDGNVTSAGLDHGYIVVPTSETSEVVLTLEMPTAVVRAHPRVDAVRGAVAIRRGPIVHCLEKNDLPGGIEIHQVRVPAEPSISQGPEDPELGVPTLQLAGAVAVAVDAALYDSQRPRERVQALAPLPLIPYYRWANRRPGAMRVWLPTESRS